MATISDKLIQLKNIKQDIKEATNNLGGNVGDDFSTYAEAINRFATYENPDFYELRTQGGTNYNGMFAKYEGPRIDVSNWDTSKVTTAKYCFYECYNTPFNIDKWDLSSLTNASYMFYRFTNGLTYIDLSNIDFSKVSNADYMFAYSNTDYLDVRNINLTGATSYERLFDSCNGTELDLSNWNIDNYTTLSYMFYSSSHTKIDLTGWRTTNIKYFSYTFYGYSSKLTHLIIPDWDMTNATSTSNFIYTSRSVLKYVDLSRSNDITISKIASFLPTKTATTFGDILVPVDTSQDAINALTAKYWKPIGPKLDLISTELVFELDEIKPGKTTKVYNINNNPWYGDDRVIEFISSDESVATINGRVITSTGVEGTVEISARNKETQTILGSATLTISETDSKPNLIKFKTNGGEGTNYILTVNGTNLKASNLTYDSASKVYSYDPGKQITSIKFYYNVSSYINEIVKFNFNAANVTECNGMFQYYQGTTLDLSNWDTSKITKANHMFCGCNNLVEIKGVLDFANLTYNIGWDATTSSIFNGCSNLETVYLKNIYKNTQMNSGDVWSIILSNTKIKDECLLYIINELPNLYDKGFTNNTTLVFALPPTNTLTAEQVQPAIDKGWIVNTNY